MGNDKYFCGAMAAIFPMAVCIFVFTLSHQFLEAVLHVNDLNELISNGLNYVFRNGGSGLSNSLLFTGFQHFLWVFGIHGGNALDAVAQDIFVNATMQNGVIVSKSFLLLSPAAFFIMREMLSLGTLLALAFNINSFSL